MRNLMILMTMIVGITMMSCGGNNNSNKVTVAEESVQMTKEKTFEDTVNEYAEKNSVNLDLSIAKSDTKELYWVGIYGDSSDSIILVKSDLIKDSMTIIYNPNNKYIIKDAVRLSNVGFMFIMEEKSSRTPGYYIQAYDIVSNEVIEKGAFPGKEYFEATYESGEDTYSFEILCDRKDLYDKFGVVKRCIEFGKSNGEILKNLVRTIDGYEFNYAEYLDGRFDINKLYKETLIDYASRGADPSRYLYSYVENAIRFKDNYGKGLHPISGVVDEIHSDNGATSLSEALLGPSGYLVVLKYELENEGKKHEFPLYCWITSREEASELVRGQEVTLWGRMRVVDDYLQVLGAKCKLSDEDLKEIAKKYKNQLRVYELRTGWFRPE